MNQKRTMMMMTRLALLVGIGLMTGWAIAACGGEEAPAAAAVSPLPMIISPLRVPALGPPEVSVTTERGALTGQSVVQSAAGETAVAGMRVGLAEVILDENSQPKVAGYAAATAPFTISDPFGRFGISGIKPGAYAIVLDSVVTQYMLNSETTGDTILTKVQANAVTDLGRMEYSSLPLPGYNVNDGASTIKVP